MRKSVKILKLLVVMLLLCALSGCMFDAMGKAIGEVFTSQMAIMGPIAINPRLFYCENGYWPESYEELDFFCSDPNNECIPMSPGNTTIEFKKAADGRLQVTGYLHNASDPCTAGNFETTLTIPDPNFCNAYRSRHEQQPHDCNEAVDLNRNK